MKRLILITGLLAALLGLVRSVDAETVVGYGSNAAGEIHLIDLGSAIKIPLSSFSTGFGAFQGLAIDSSGETLYCSDQNGLLYSIGIATERTMLIGDMGLGTVEAMDFNINGTELWVTDFQSIDPDHDPAPPSNRPDVIDRRYRWTDRPNTRR